MANFHDDFVLLKRTDHQLVECFQSARRDPSLVVLEGFHALKHAVRFGADIQQVLTSDKSGLESLIDTQAPDISDRLGACPLSIVDAQLYKRCVHHTHATGLVSIAKRPAMPSPTDVPADKVLILIENARHTGNLGAVIRVAAAADAGGVLVLGGVDPWNPAVIRGAAGLHFALPVLLLSDVADLDQWPERSLLAMTTEVLGWPKALPCPSGTSAPVVAFGSERDGLSQSILTRADNFYALPQREGVSSLNLATAVAAYLYGPGWKIGN